MKPPTTAPPTVTVRPQFILGVDPGLEGALGILDLAGLRYRVIDMPTIQPKGGKRIIDARSLADIVGDLVYEYDDMIAVVENVAGRPRQQGVFHFGLSTGIIHGVLATHCVPYTLVTSPVWKGALHLSRGKDETSAQHKTRSRLMAAQLFPTLADAFRRVQDDGRAEAMLMAHYLRMTLEA